VEGVDTYDVGAADVRGQVLAAGVEGEFGRADETRLVDRVGDPVRQPLTQQRRIPGRQQFLERGGRDHLARPGERVHPRRQRRPQPLGLQLTAADVRAAELRVDVGDDHGVVALGRLGRAEGHVHARVLAVGARLHRARQGGGEEQQRHPETHADAGEQDAHPALTAAGEREPGAHGQVPGPLHDHGDVARRLRAGGRPRGSPGRGGGFLPCGHTARSMSRDLPSRTTISRSE
jgi:hypothetical protein